MPSDQKDFGRLISTHTISPAYFQCAAFMAVLSFLFFLAMMIGFYARRNVGYFLLATAFLLVYLATMFSLFSQRRTAVNIFENGITYKKFSARWSEVTATETTEKRSSRRPLIELRKKDGQSMVLPDTVTDAEGMMTSVRRRVSSID
jgi:hypothetical protein